MLDLELDVENEKGVARVRQSVEGEASVVCFRSRLQKPEAIDLGVLLCRLDIDSELLKQSHHNS